MRRKEKSILLSLGNISDKYLDQAKPRKRQGNAGRIIAVAASLVLVVGLSVWIAMAGGMQPDSGDPTVSTGLVAVMKDYLLSDSGEVDVNLGAVAPDGGNGSGSPDGGSGSLSPNGNYMEVTDNQVAGIVEGDVIKATDKYIFRLGNHTIYIYSISGDSSELVSSYTIPHILGEDSYNKNYDMFLSGDGKTITLFGKYSSRTVVMSIDVSDIYSPKERDRVTVSGYKNTVRMIDGKFYLITNCYFERNKIDLDAPETFIPSIERGEDTRICDVNKVVYPEKIANVSYKYLTVFDENLQLSDEMAMMVSGSPVFTENSIVFVYGYAKSETVGDKAVSRAYSKIGVLDISAELKWRGDFTIQGWVGDRFAIDESDGALRIVTSVSDRAGYRTQYDNASLYVYDIESLQPIASVESFAPEGEGATAVRFEGDKLYVCTAETAEYLDPVYFFDLSDYKNITHTQTGFINGFSTSLIDMGEGYLLGVGREDEANNKLEVYKRTGDEVVSVDKYIFDGSMSTDYKSFLINRDENLFGVYLQRNKIGKTEMVFEVVRIEDGIILPTVEIAINESVNTPRAFAKGGFVYFTHANALYVREIDGDGECSRVFKHSFSEWVTIEQAECEGLSTQKRLCSCGRVETQRYPSGKKHQVTDGICTLCGYDLGTVEKNKELIIYTSNGDGTCTVTGTRARVFCTVNIPTHSPKGEEVVGIGHTAFAYSSIEVITIPKTVRFIDVGAFYNCSRLTTVTFDENSKGGIFASKSSLVRIGKSAFTYCESLKEIIIPDGVTEIGDGAFESCDVLERVHLPQSLTKISRGLFNLCDNLSDVNIPDGVTVIDEFAFNFCNKLLTVKIPSKVATIGKRAFGSCGKLFSIELGSGVREISENAFADCDAIVEVVNKSSLDIKVASEDHGSIALYAVSVTRGISNIKNVGDYYFHLTDDKNTLVAYTGSDTELYLPDCPGGGEYEIGNRVFKSRDDITSVHIPDGVSAIGTEAFRECNGLKSMILPDSVKLISERAFLGCDFISFYMGDGVVSIGKMAFRGCGKLESISMSKSLEVIGDEAFSMCYKLDLDIPSSVKVIGYGAFSGCFALSHAVIPDGVTVIESRTFDNCKALTTVVIPDSVAVIKDAFYACPRLSSICYKGSKAEWENISIDYNNGLFGEVQIIYNYK